MRSRWLIGIGWLFALCCGAQAGDAPSPSDSDPAVAKPPWRLTVDASLGGGRGGVLWGGPLRGKSDSCYSAEDLAILESVLDAPAPSAAPEGSGAGVAGGSLPRPYEFYPMAGRLGEDLYISAFADLDPTRGVRDWGCDEWSYNGHDASDTSLHTFGEQFVGVPVFAALDGRVLATEDGHPDLSGYPGVGIDLHAPANFVILDHGQGHRSLYYHLVDGSVAVQQDQYVLAGEQLGLTGSSGASTGPHLHFSTYLNGEVFEPFTGECNPGPSGFAEQPPQDRSTVFLRDFGVSYHDDYPGHPAEYPRTGQVALTDRYVHLWFLPNNLPAGSTWRVRFHRPDSTVALESNAESFGLDVFQPASWWWHSWDVSEMHSILGTWALELEINGQTVVHAPIEVRAERTIDFNRPPEPVTISFEPVEPTPSDVIFCRVSGPLLLDDLDYDIVRYEYAWTVNGEEVRRLVSAGRSDAIPRHTASLCGDVVRCVVTPSDGKDEGGSVSHSVTVGLPGCVPSECDVDCDGNGVPDECDLRGGTLTDIDGNGVPDVCEVPGGYADDPEIEIPVDAVAFGEVDLGNTASLTVTVANGGLVNPLEILAVELGPETSSAFLVADSGTPQQLPAGESLTLTISFAPATEGAHSGELRIVTNDADEAVAALPLSGDGVAPPRAEIKVSPVALDFGDVTVKSTKTRTVSIENLGNAPLRVTRATLGGDTGPEFRTDSTYQDVIVAPGWTLTIQVAYSPVDVGSDGGALLIGSDDSNEGLTIVFLAGNGLPRPVPDIEIASLSLNFGEKPVGTIESQIVSIRNVGLSPLWVSAVEFQEGTSSEFETDFPAHGVTVGPQEDFPVSVTYSPMDAGSDTGFLLIRNDDEDEELVEIAIAGSSPELLPAGFLRGDCNGDGRVDISDAVATLEGLFLGARPIPCEDACDANDDGGVDIADPVATLGALFFGQGEIPSPGKDVCGEDPSDDTLACETNGPCP